GARAGTAGLRDVDGREARPRPRVDRGSLRAAVPPHGRRDGMARAGAVGARARIARRLIAVALVAATVVVAVVAVVVARHRPHGRGTPHLLVGVADDTLKWTADPI